METREQVYDQTTADERKQRELYGKYTPVQSPPKKGTETDEDRKARKAAELNSHLFNHQDDSPEEKLKGWEFQNKRIDAGSNA